MTVTQNNFLGPAALIFSCCFPAKTGWVSETCGLGASHEFASGSMPSEDSAAADKTLFDVIRGGRALVCGGRSLRVF
jgi:hypothetical protein